MGFLKKFSQNGTAIKPAIDKKVFQALNGELMVQFRSKLCIGTGKGGFKGGGQSIPPPPE